MPVFDEIIIIQVSGSNSRSVSLKGNPMQKSHSWQLAVLMATVLGAFGCWPLARLDAADQKKEDPALERTRKTVKMLDDIYKTAIVLITDKYVHDEDDFPAGSAAVAWFDAIRKKGWHEVLLLDATGDPYNGKNVARDAFDREAIKQLKSGLDYYDQVVDINGRPHLRAATPVPVVMKKCIMCHPHYAHAKEGQPIGLLSYTLKIE